MQAVRDSGCIKVVKVIFHEILNKCLCYNYVVVALTWMI